MELLNDTLIQWGKDKALRFDIEFKLEDNEPFVVYGFIVRRGLLIIPQRPYTAKGVQRYADVFKLSESTFKLIKEIVQGWRDKYPEVEFP